MKCDCGKVLTKGWAFCPACGRPRKSGVLAALLAGDVENRDWQLRVFEASVPLERGSHTREAKRDAIFMVMANGMTYEDAANHTGNVTPATVKSWIDETLMRLRYAGLLENEDG